MKQFYKNWKLTRLETEAVKVIKAGKKLVLDNVNKDKIIAIYIGGSFIRREMNEKSDVDMWAIVKDMKTLNKVIKIGQNNRKSFKPELCASGYSIGEFKKGKTSAKGKRIRPSPSKFLKKIQFYRLIYGKKLNVNDFPINSDKKDLQGMIFAFKNIFIPGYEKGKFGVQSIIKQLFWLIEFELGTKGKKVPYSMKKFVKLLPNNHIIHQAYKLRVKPTKDKRIRARFIKRLKAYIKNLGKAI